MQILDNMYRPHVILSPPSYEEDKNVFQFLHHILNVDQVHI